MNLFLPESAFTKLFTVLILLGSLTTCQVKSAEESRSPQQHPFIASTTQPVQAGNRSGELFNQGQQRTYYLHIPTSYQPDQPLPLVLVFHKYAGNGKKMAVSSGMSNLADREGFIVVYPDAVDKRWNIAGHAPTDADDVAFVSALIAHLSQTLAIDQQRIYATGSSNGGYLVQRLACEMPAQFAAFASVAASLVAQNKPSCHPQTPISMMMINGTADDVVPWEGGAPPKVRIGKDLSSLPILEVINFWRQLDACSSEVPLQQLKKDLVEIYDYPNCQDSSEVTLVALKGGKHVWPGSGSRFLEASTAIWDFFQRHTLTK